MDEPLHCKRAYENRTIQNPRNFQYSHRPRRFRMRREVAAEAGISSTGGCTINGIHITNFWYSPDKLETL